MELENRYLVVKRSDIEQDLSFEQRAQLDDLLYRVTLGRAVRGKRPRNFVVIQSNWTLYGLAKRLVEAEVHRDACKTEEATLRRIAEHAPDNVFIQKLGVAVEQKTIRIRELEQALSDIGDLNQRERFSPEITKIIRRTHK